MSQWCADFKLLSVVCGCVERIPFSQRTCLTKIARFWTSVLLILVEFRSLVPVFAIRLGWVVEHVSLCFNLTHRVPNVGGLVCALLRFQLVHVGTPSVVAGRYVRVGYQAAMWKTTSTRLRSFAKL